MSKEVEALRKMDEEERMARRCHKLGDKKVECEWLRCLHAGVKLLVCVGLICVPPHTLRSFVVEFALL